MNSHHKAHDILDRVRAGGYASDRLVKRALTVTGDLPSMDDKEAAHFICPTKEGHAGMDDTAEWAQTHPMVVGEKA